MTNLTNLVSYKPMKFYIFYSLVANLNDFISNLFSIPLAAPSLARHKQQRLPQCLIIGVRKGGTRALLDALAIQPYIRVARREIHFFNDNETYNKGSEWYRRQMPYTYPEQVSTESLLFF